MSYTLTASDGTVNINISDGTFDTSTSLTLSGPNATGYGQFLDQDLLLLLTSFASNSAPGGTNLQGQLWFNKNTQALQVFTSQGYLPVSGILVATSPPVVAYPGNIWFNSSTNQMFFYDGSNWDLIGPVYTKAQGPSGVFPVQVNDAYSTGLTHNILQLQYGNVVLATVSADATFTPTPSIPGISTIHPGITFSSNVANPTINTNIVGSVTGNLTGNVTGNLTGSLVTTANINVSGNVTGNVIGNVVGNLTGNVSGNVNATTVITGTLNSVNLTGCVAVITSLINNTLTSNSATIIGGNISGIGTLSATRATVTNFSSGNVLVSGGSATGMTALSATNVTATNSVTAGSAQINTTANVGSITACTASTVNATVGTQVATNFSSPNVQITGGNITGMNSVNMNTSTVTAYLQSGSFSTPSAAINNLTTTNLYSNLVSVNTVNAATIGNSGATVAGTTGNFGTVNASTIKAVTVGNTGAILTGSTLTVTNGYVSTLNSATVQAATIGNTGATLTGTLSSGAQPNITGTSASLTAGAATTLYTGSNGFTIQQVGSKLYFQFNGTNIASLDSSGNFQTAQNITAYQSTGSL